MKPDYSRISIALTEPEVQGNVGAVARVMKNTNFSNLILVGQSFLDDDAYARAKEASTFLDGCKYYESVSNLRKDFDIIVGTSSVTSRNLKDYRRIPVKPDYFWSNYYDPSMTTCILLGREGDGLRNHELELCDFFITIPGSEIYPIYNLSHAAAIIMYEGMKLESVDFPGKERASGEEMGILVDRIIEISQKVNFPVHKIPSTRVMLRRLFSRAALSGSEYHRIMGILRKIDLASVDINHQSNIDLAKTELIDEIRRNIKDK
ncbi:MAG: TrmJ/YjtD family RNA methyltransferase [Candidatus Thermoplasmatota archaeon]|nr:TrmJ/YjtD family RNA methyltransferase [Candidatus Thermoplasmatota archaeon]